MANHENLGYVHQVHDSRLVYATYAEMMADTPTEGLVGKLSTIIEDGSTHRLDQVNPCVKWSLFSGKDVTRGPMNLYIDPVNGDDTKGNGAASYPFRSFRFLLDLPKKCLHQVKLRPKEGDYDYWPEILNIHCEGEGRIILDASGETYPVVAGEFTVGSVTGVGEQYYGYWLSTDIQVQGAPGWTPNEFYPRYIHWLTGGWAGYVMPVFKHDEDTIRTGSNWYGAGSGDTFNIVRPPVRITVPNIAAFNGNFYGYGEYQGGGSLEAPYTPIFLAAGIELRTNDIREGKTPIRLENFSSVFNFCTLMNEHWEGGNNVDVVGMKRATLNVQQLPATFDNPVMDDWFAFTTWIATHENEPHHEAYADLGLSESFASGVCCRGGIGFRERTSFHSGSSIIYSLTGGIYKTASGYCDATSLHLEQVDYPPASQGPAIRDLGGPSLRLDGVWIESCTTPIFLPQGGYIVATWLKGNLAGISGDYALRIDSASKFMIPYPDDVTIMGQVGAIKFVWSGAVTPTHASWPTSGQQLDDGAGARVIVNDGAESRQLEI